MTSKRSIETIEKRTSFENDQTRIFQDQILLMARENVPMNKQQKLAFALREQDICAYKAVTDSKHLDFLANLLKD